VKNVFVAARWCSSRHLTDPGLVLRAALATLAFCALSGAVYAFNDVRDAEAIGKHATKRYRPVAARALSERAALVLSGTLAAAALAAAWR